MKLSWFVIFYSTKSCEIAMTAVPSQRQKTKDSFQMELDHAIAKRKSAGLATGFSDDDDDAYEDDFEDEDEVDDMGKISESNIWHCLFYSIACASRIFHEC